MNSLTETENGLAMGLPATVFQGYQLSWLEIILQACYVS